MKTIKWEDPDNANGVYTPLIFCHISPDNVQALPWGGCVGWLWDSMQGFVLKKQLYYGYKIGINPPFCTDKTYIGVSRAGDNSFHERVQRLINLFEKRANLSPLTVVYPSQINGRFVYEGPVDWVRSSFMLSLYTNLMRIVYEGADVSSIYKFKKWVRENTKKRNTMVKSYMNPVYPYINKIIRHRKKLDWNVFPYPEGGIHSYGIRALIETYELGSLSYRPNTKQAIDDFHKLIKGGDDN